MRFIEQLNQLDLLARGKTKIYPNPAAKVETMTAVAVEIAKAKRASFIKGHSNCICSLK